MKKIIIFLGVLIIIAGIAGTSLFTLNIIRANTATKAELGAIQNTLTEKEAEITSLKTENETLKDKMSTARTYATFLSLALCPTLESGNKSSLCMHDGTEWFNQTLQAGSATADVTIKSSMDAFTQSLGNTKKLSSKQFHETLKPLEARAIRLIVESTSN